MKKNTAKFNIPQWDVFKPGDVVEMKGAFFVIHRINPLAKQIILLGVEAPKLKENQNETRKN